MTSILRKAVQLAICLCIAVLAVPSVGSASQESGWFYITKLYDGWSGEGMGVESSIAVVNDGCQWTGSYFLRKEVDANGHITNSYQEKTAMLVAALLNNYEVSVVVDGCVESKPKIVQVRIRPPQ